MAGEVSGLKITASPDWLQKRLKAVGQRPINNVVDITNYVMFELGEPTHVFDQEKIDGNLIEVRRAEPGEQLVTLAGQARKLAKEFLVISDRAKPIALAGLMGGANTEITNETKAILFEAANFDAGTVRKMSQKLNLRTEGSNRWEKALPPNLAELGIRRALFLMKQILPQAKFDALYDVSALKYKKIIIQVSHEFLEQRIGHNFSQNDLIDLLERLGFGVQTKNSEYSLTVPYWRSTGDISIAADIVEEIARIHGYNNLGADKIKVS